MKKIILILCCMLFISTAFCQNSVVVSEQSIHDNTLNSITKDMTKAFETTNRHSKFDEIEVETTIVPLTIECEN